ncbi:hypothetical protein ACQ5SO_03430 [Rhodovulum sp. DZ06]|uniref:hypothetical protein n=1 Tax=Rhodovulum sp. DZ06 TaxID=3425126 RepID=UPI003D33C916
MDGEAPEALDVPAGGPALGAREVPPAGGPVRRRAARRLAQRVAEEALARIIGGDAAEHEGQPFVQRRVAQHGAGQPERVLVEARGREELAMRAEGRLHLVLDHHFLVIERQDRRARFRRHHVGDVAPGLVARRPVHGGEAPVHVHHHAGQPALVRQPLAQAGEDLLPVQRGGVEAEIGETDAPVERDRGQERVIVRDHAGLRSGQERAQRVGDEARVLEIAEQRGVDVRDARAVADSPVVVHPGLPSLLNAPPVQGGFRHRARAPRRERQSETKG